MADRLTVRALRALLADLPDGLPVVIFNPAAATFEFAEAIQTGRVRHDGEGWVAVGARDARGAPVVWVRT